MKFDLEELWYCSFATDKDRVKAILNVQLMHWIKSVRTTF